MFFRLRLFTRLFIHILFLLTLFVKRRFLLIIVLLSFAHSFITLFLEIPLCNVDFHTVGIVISQLYVVISDFDKNQHIVTILVWSWRVNTNYVSIFFSFALQVINFLLKIILILGSHQQPNFVYFIMVQLVEPIQLTVNLLPRGNILIFWWFLFVFLFTVIFCFGVVCMMVVMFLIGAVLIAIVNPFYRNKILYSCWRSSESSTKC